MKIVDTHADVLVVLVHGFCRGGKDMLFWRDNLADVFPNIVIADMPAKYSSFEQCLASLSSTVKQAQPEKYRAVYLAGHSMGGLLLREYLQQSKLPNARKLVCAGTPHYGSRLADIALLMPFAGFIWPPLKALKSSARKVVTTPDIPGLEIGAIVGNNNAHWPGKLFLSDAADGLVETFSAHAPDAQNVVYTNVPHDPMQYDIKIVNWIKEFFLTGSFTG